MTDNGCGMSDELMARIFEPFARGEASVTNKIQGTGLGLPITKSFVESMNGTISVESTEGVGSCFTVLLNLEIYKYTDVEASEQSEEEKKESGGLRGRRFLCAEDNELNAEILESLLKACGAECTIYPDGAQLVEAFKTVKPGEYDAVLMDVQMPNMNGLDATRAIRAGENPLGRSIPIFAMTANAFAEDVQSCMEAGMDIHLSKPVDMGQLNNALSAFLGLHTPMNIWR